MRVGFDLWTQDQAGLIGDNDPRFALFGNFGDFDVMAAAVLELTGQRLGLTNDNDLWYYTFSAGYHLRAHRFQLDVTYFRDRFNGAETNGFLGGPLFRGQKTDSVLVMGSWGGSIGLVRALVQGNLMLGHATGANAAGLALTGLTGAVPAGKHYDIFAGSVVAYGEVDLGIVRPFLMFLWAAADGDPTDHKLHGFNPYPYHTTGTMTGTSWFAHLDTSNAVSTRDYSCPARFQGLSAGGGAPGIPGRTATGAAINPVNVGTAAINAGPGFTECSHTVTSPFNDELGSGQLGIFTALANPGTLLIPVGLRAFPLRAHEVTGWYLYRAMVDTTSLEVAFAPELAARNMQGIRTAEYHEIGGYWLWSLNPNFDIRLAGNIAIAGGGYCDLAHLANCSPGGTGPYVTSPACSGKDPALYGEARFRARF